MRDPSDWLNQYIKDSREAIEKLSTNDISITSLDIQNALVEVLGLEDSRDLIYMELPAAKIIELLSPFNFYKYRPEILCEVTLDESIVPSNIPTPLSEQTVRTKGEVWVIHKNDADPFPSNPHAHNYGKNLVVHLGNGNLYRKREYLGRLKKKHLFNLRSLIKNVDLPSLSM